MIENTIKTVNVRRQPTNEKMATYDFDDITELEWRDVGGGVKAQFTHTALCGKVYCNMMLSGTLAHSCEHPGFPHHIVVTINKKDNLPEIFDELAKKAGQKPANTNRKQLKKAEKADIIYFMWTAKTAAAEYSQSKLSNTPDIVYANSANAAFIERCQKMKVNWGLISPANGIWLPDETNVHSSRRLNELGAQEKTALIYSMQSKLSKYQKIRIYAPQGYDKTKLHEEIFEEADLTVLFLTTIKDIGVR